MSETLDNKTKRELRRMAALDGYALLSCGCKVTENLLAEPIGMGELSDAHLMDAQTSKCKFVRVGRRSLTAGALNRGR